MKEEMVNLKESLKNVRKLCPEMSDDMYILTDYIADNMDESVIPLKAVITIVCVMDDIQKSRNGFGKEFPEILKERKDSILNEFLKIPQVIEYITSENFFKEFKNIWDEMLKNYDNEETYPKYVKVAVDWWTDAIILPKFDNGDNFAMLLSISLARNTKKYSEKEIITFKNSLSKTIFEEIELFGICDLFVDYTPCRELETAGNKIGINPAFGYPCKARMIITKKQITLKTGYSAEIKTLWKA